jgi:hypothetical protein
MRKVVDSRTPGLPSTAVVVATVLIIAFVSLWIGQWSLSASAYPARRVVARVRASLAALDCRRAHNHV